MAAWQRYYNIIVTGFVPRLWVMTLWKIFAVTAKIFHNVINDITVIAKGALTGLVSLRDL